jgi:hypothetical protein
MRESQADPISSIVKLVDAVNHFADLLVSTTATQDVRQPLQRFMERMHWKAKQFEFELRTELKRLLADIGLVSPATEMSLRAGFEAILESYRQALASHLTAHTRAMITRQFHEMRIAYEEFASLCKAA